MKITNPFKNFHKRHLQTRLVSNVGICKGCGACKPVCPTEAIDFFAYIPPVDLPPKTGEPRLRPQIDYDKCEKCNRCKQECPNSAIEIFTPRLMKVLR